MPGAARALDDAELARLTTDMARRLGVRAARHEPLAKLTTMRVGGPADLLVQAHNLFELRGLIRFARSRELPWLILGRGSDVVIADAGVRGLVIVNRAAQHVFADGRLTADSGLAMARAATLAKDAGLSGLEFGLAIPGTIGGAVWANAGAHEADIAGVLVEAGVLAADGTEQRLAAQQLALGYRDSALKHAAAGAPAICLWATFQLTPAAPAEIAARLDDIRRWRQAHQPLGMPSAGSVFRNPESGPSAGALIDGLGLKGLRIGGAVVSERHANFIVNDAGGSAADVRQLMELVQARVLAETGMALQPEIVFIGDWSDWDGGAAA